MKMAKTKNKNKKVNNFTGIYWMNQSKILNRVDLKRRRIFINQIMIINKMRIHFHRREIKMKKIHVDLMISNKNNEIVIIFQFMYNLYDEMIKVFILIITIYLI